MTDTTSPFALDSARAVLAGWAAKRAPGGRGGAGRPEGAPALGKNNDARVQRPRITRQRRRVLAGVTELKRVAWCRRCYVRPVVGVRVKDEWAHLTGVMVCGAVWACPECSARIRGVRSQEIGQAIARHMEAGGTAWMVTLTARHRAGMELAPMLDSLQKAMRYVLGGRAANRERDELGIAGIIKATEITHGAAGWHPHYHVLVLLDGVPDTTALTAAMLRWSRAWRTYLATRGMEPSEDRGVTWVAVHRAAEAGEYLAKLQDGGNVGMEVARGDLKAGRLGSLHPFELLDYIGLTGDMDAIDLWREYERATFGRRAITWSPGLRRRLLDTAHRSDEEIVEEEVGGVDVCRFTSEDWQRIDRHGLINDLLEAAEDAPPESAYDAVAAVTHAIGVTPMRPPDG